MRLQGKGPKMVYLQAGAEQGFAQDFVILAAASI
jgi:hypothetical protein